MFSDLNPMQYGCTIHLQHVLVCNDIDNQYLYNFIYDIYLYNTYIYYIYTSLYSIFLYYLYLSTFLICTYVEVKSPACWVRPVPSQAGKSSR